MQDLELGKPARAVEHQRDDASHAQELWGAGPEAEAGVCGKPKQDYRMGIKFDEAGSSGGAGGIDLAWSGPEEVCLVVEEPACRTGLHVGPA